MVSRKKVREKQASPSTFKHIDTLLDEALQESFPASDAIAVDFREPQNVTRASNNAESGSATMARSKPYRGRA
jgi:hypothetical protein